MLYEKLIPYKNFIQEKVSHDIKKKKKLNAIRKIDTL